MTKLADHRPDAAPTASMNRKEAADRRPSKRPSQSIRLLAVASAGGHWEELMLLRPAFEGFDVHYATTLEGFAERERLTKVHVLPDANRHRPLRTIACAWTCWNVIRSIRPHYVVTTGALPGLTCGLIGRLFGARTIWVDSIANSERLSMSGTFAGRFAALSVTQWEHLAQDDSPAFHGALL